jgi:lysyl-tRNA synthetase class 2
VNDWQPTASIATLEQRAHMLARVRGHFAKTAALEVETPTLSTAAVTDVHLASIRAEVCGAARYLHTSPEYAMKRLLAAHRRDLWQVVRVYRDGESGRWHNPEFTMIEWYRVGIDDRALMHEVEAVVKVAVEPYRALQAAERLTYADAMTQYAQIDAFEASIDELRARLLQADIEVPASLQGDRDAHLDLVMATLVGPQLGRDRVTFIQDYPASQAALARVHGKVAARFEAYLDGVELANGFHELSDTAEQRTRFERDLRARIAAGLATPPLDERFLAALNHGLPDCAGVALGFDRLVMCALRAQHIDEVLAFAFARA